MDINKDDEERAEDPPWYFPAIADVMPVWEPATQKGGGVFQGSSYVG